MSDTKFIVPAQPGFAALVYMEDDRWVEAPIIAWTVYWSSTTEPPFALPVTTNSEINGMWDEQPGYAIRDPSGSVCAGGAMSFASAVMWAAHCRKMDEAAAD